LGKHINELVAADTPFYGVLWRGFQCKRSSNLPLALAAADTVEAMVSDRLYRKALPLERNPNAQGQAF